jgi:chorismate mutase
LYRNLPQWHIPIELKRRFPDLPLISDPSHIGGKRELIAPLSQQAMDLNYDGLMIESHCTPDEAWSDKEQQITPDVLFYILNLLVIRDTKQTTEGLTELRRQIDRIDDELLMILAKRMRVSREIGQYKKEHHMPVLQTHRYDEILDKRISQANDLGMSTAFMKEVLEAIHEESIRQQIVILNQS